MPDDTQQQSPTVSDIGGHSPTMSDLDRLRPTVTDDVAAAALAKKERSAAHSLTTAEVAKLFEHEQLGIRNSYPSGF